MPWPDEEDGPGGGAPATTGSETGGDDRGSGDDVGDARDDDGRFANS